MLRVSGIPGGAVGDLVEAKAVNVAKLETRLVAGLVVEIDDIEEGAGQFVPDLETFDVRLGRVESDEIESRQGRSVVVDGVRHRR